MKIFSSRYSTFAILLILIFIFLPSRNELRSEKFIPTHVEVLVSCGDGDTEAGTEVCDPGQPPIVPEDIGTTTCASFNDVFGNPFQSGDLNCASDCLAYDPSLCFTCGNGVKELGEDCEGVDFGTKTCSDYGFVGGTLECNIECQITTINCIAKDKDSGQSGHGSSGGSSGSPSGYIPGTDELKETKVVMKGKAYPDSDVHILLDGVVIGIVRADPKADFYFESNQITPGVASFGFWSEDKAGLKSTLLTLTFRVISRAVTTISGIYISPTIEIDKKSVKQGETIKIYGQTIPETQVNVHINSEAEIIKEINSLRTGTWELNFDTAPLAEDFHTAKALFQVAAEGNIIKSGFSRSVSFHVGKLGGEAVCPNADLNKDGRVNLTDFSILLYYWGTDNSCADQNQNGVVDLVDFSIMMYYWTG